MFLPVAAGFAAAENVIFIAFDLWNLPTLRSSSLFAPYVAVKVVLCTLHVESGLLAAEGDGFASPNHVYRVLVYFLGACTVLELWVINTIITACVAFLPLLIVPIVLRFAVPTSWEAASTTFGMLEVELWAISMLYAVLMLRKGWLESQSVAIERQTCVRLVTQAAKAQALLESAVPRSVARALISGVPVEELTRSFQCASVAFIALVDFEERAVSLRPHELILWLDSVYNVFDCLIDLYDESINKIETVGNVYLVSAGLPLEDPDHHVALASFCADVVDLCSNINGVKVNVKIGLHCGPVTAGIIGETRRFYRIFGDTVNVASRMMSTGECNRVHCSASIAELLRDHGRHGLRIDYRGNTFVKGKGHMDTFWIERSIEAGETVTSERKTLAVTMAAELEPTSAAARLNSIIRADASMGSRNDFHAGGVSSRVISSTQMRPSLFREPSPRRPETGRLASPRSFNFSEQPAAKGLVDLKSDCEPRQAIVQQSLSKDVAVRIDNSAWHPRVVSPSLSEAAAGFVSRVTAAEVEHVIGAGPKSSQRLLRSHRGSKQSHDVVMLSALHRLSEESSSNQSLHAPSTGVQASRGGTPSTLKVSISPKSPKRQAMFDALMTTSPSTCRKVEEDFKLPDSSRTNYVKAATGGDQRGARSPALHSSRKSQAKPLEESALEPTLEPATIQLSMMGPVVSQAVPSSPSSVRPTAAEVNRDTQSEIIAAPRVLMTIASPTVPILSSPALGIHGTPDVKSCNSFIRTRRLSAADLRHPSGTFGVDSPVKRQTFRLNPAASKFRMSEDTTDSLMFSPASMSAATMSLKMESQDNNRSLATRRNSFIQPQSDGHDGASLSHVDPSPSCGVLDTFLKDGAITAVNSASFQRRRHSVALDAKALGGITGAEPRDGSFLRKTPLSPQVLRSISLPIPHEALVRARRLSLPCGDEMRHQLANSCAEIPAVQSPVVPQQTLPCAVDGSALTTQSSYGTGSAVPVHIARAQSSVDLADPPPAPVGATIGTDRHDTSVIITNSDCGPFRWILDIARRSIPRFHDPLLERDAQVKLDNISAVAAVATLIAVSLLCLTSGLVALISHPLNSSFVVVNPALILMSALCLALAWLFHRSDVTVAFKLIRYVVGMAAASVVVAVSVGLLGVLEFKWSVVVISSAWGDDSSSSRLFLLLPVIVALHMATFFSLRYYLAASISCLSILIGLVFAVVAGSVSPDKTISGWLVFQLVFAAAATTGGAYVAEFRQRLYVISYAAAQAAEAEASEIVSNLIPAQVVKKIVSGEDVHSVVHAGVAILYADLVGFTRMSATMEPTDLMRSLNAIYSRFDALVEACPGLWKVETIGDAYIVVGGLFEVVDNDTDACAPGSPRPGNMSNVFVSQRPATNSSGASLGRERRTREHLESIMSLAASLHETLGQFRDSLGLDIHMRIGVHSGDVVTGIIGSHRPRFSVLGLSLMIAEIVESMAETDMTFCTVQAQNAYLASSFTFLPVDSPDESESRRRLEILFSHEKGAIYNSFLDPEGVNVGQSRLREPLQAATGTARTDSTVATGTARTELTVRVIDSSREDIDTESSSFGIGLRNSLPCIPETRVSAPPALVSVTNAVKSLPIYAIGQEAPQELVRVVVKKSAVPRH